MAKVLLFEKKTGKLPRGPLQPNHKPLPVSGSKTDGFGRPINKSTGTPEDLDPQAG